MNCIQNVTNFVLQVKSVEMSVWYFYTLCYYFFSQPDCKTKCIAKPQITVNGNVYNSRFLQYLCMVVNVWLKLRIEEINLKH